MTSPGLTVRPDLSENQVARLIAVASQEQPRNWRWLTSWVTKASEYYNQGTVSFNVNGQRHVMFMIDAEAIVRFYENPDNWQEYEYDAYDRAV